MISLSLLKNEIVDSAEDVLHRRASTPIYGTFVISWSIFHWEFLYTAFFVSQDHVLTKSGLLKQEYLAQMLYNWSWQDWVSYIPWVGPFVMTWLIIWILPKWLLLPAFKKDEEYRVEKLKARLHLERDITVDKTQLVKQEKIQLETETQKVAAQKKLEKADPRVLWEREYADFQKTKLYSVFQKIIDAVYLYAGRVVVTDDSMYDRPEIFRIPRDLLAFAHTDDLIAFNKDRTAIELTDKGKFYVGQYTRDKSK